LCHECPGSIDGQLDCRSGNQASPPTSISPLPSHFGQRPVPPHEEHEVSPPSPPDAAENPPPPLLPLPRHAEQFPSPGESQSMQTWVVMRRLPVTWAILIAFHAHVKPNRFDKTNEFNRNAGVVGINTGSQRVPVAQASAAADTCATPNASRLLALLRKFDRSSRSRIAASEARLLLRESQEPRPD
jgi:hypothetical protein